MIDRSDAVNLARNVLREETHYTITPVGVRRLAEAVMAMDEYIRMQPEARAVREALEFYATASHYYEACVPLQDDGGERARRALALLPQSRLSDCLSESKHCRKNNPAITDCCPTGRADAESK